MAKRAKGTGMVTWGLMALLVLGLGGFGVTNFGGSVRSIASVGDREIGVNDYARALTAEARALSQQIGQNVGFEQVQALGRDGAVRAGLIAAAAQDNEAGRIGISVGDEQVRTQIVAAPEFQGLNGQFDPKAYAEALRQEGLTQVEFETRLRKSAARAILQAAIVGGIEAPGVYTDTLTAWATETRSFTDAELIAADLSDPVGDASDAELQAHYDANIADFTSLETRAITYVWLAPEIDDRKGRDRRNSTSRRL